MTEWTNEELNRIGSAEELQIAGRKAEGTLRKPVIIWVVRVGDNLFVRSVNGRSSVWFRGVLVRHDGRIWAGGVQKDITNPWALDEEASRTIIKRALDLGVNY
ncbi:MAG: DUF2255 family protein [Anaerolineaceae bacterium]|nr:DUF2255 family protein [Anaerolineaceae bacterium]